MNASSILHFRLCNLKTLCLVELQKVFHIPYLSNEKYLEKGKLNNEPKDWREGQIEVLDCFENSIVICLCIWL